MLHSVGKSINYAEYARQGFFQLMLVSLINKEMDNVNYVYEPMIVEKDSVKNIN